MAELKTGDNSFNGDFNDFKTAVIERLDQIEDRMTVGSEALQFLDRALECYRQDLGQSFGHPNNLLQLISRDDRLKWGHRKLLEALLARYSYKEEAFEELNFSKLAMQAHVSKQRAKCHLEELEGWNLVKRRSDGYRIFFCINEAMAKTTASQRHSAQR